MNIFESFLAALVLIPVIILGFILDSWIGLVIGFILILAAIEALLNAAVMILRLFRSLSGA